MKVINRMEFVTRYQVICPECLSTLEGKWEEFKNKTSMSDSWMEFECPVCRTNQKISCYYNTKWCKRIRYKLNDDGSIGDEIKD